MGNSNSWLWKTRVVVPLVVLALAFGMAGLAFGGSTLFRFLGRPYSLPLWSLILLALGPVALLAGGIALLWKIHQGPGEMERRPIVVKGVRWRWWTEHNGSLRVVPYCEACDLQLRPREGTDDPNEVLPGFVLHCNNCSQETIRFHGSLDHAPQLVLDYFMQNLRKEFELSHPGS